MSAKPSEPIVLSGVVNLQTVVTLRRDAVSRGKSAIENGGDLVFDLKELAVEGSAVITLLLSILRDLKEEAPATGVSFSGSSDALKAIADASGVADVLGLSR